jgi:AcrR family transcriptional regulator
MGAKMTHLRADAQANRDRILLAAQELFAERGLDVGMREIARRAEVGPATLYRHFPTKQAVVEEAFGVAMNICGKIVVDACEDPDPWRGFAAAVTGLIELHTLNRGFVDAFTAAQPETGRLQEHRRELLRMLDALARRAQREGALRADFTIDDLVLVLQAGRGLAPVGARARAAQARRFAGLLLDAFRTDQRCKETSAG